MYFIKIFYIIEKLYLIINLIYIYIYREETAKPVVTSVLLTDFTPVSLPISLLVRPLRQRFIYHFTGSKLTNRQDKPEWFFTQILTWIKDHVQWVQKNVQPVANSIGLNYVDMKVLFNILILLFYN